MNEHFFNCSSILKKMHVLLHYVHTYYDLRQKSGKQSCVLHHFMPSAPTYNTCPPCVHACIACIHTCHLVYHMYVRRVLRYRHRCFVPV